MSATNRQEAMRQFGDALESESEPRTLPPPTNPMATARELIAEKHHGNGALMLRHWRGSWMRWDRGVWAEIEERTVRADAYRQTEHAVYVHASKDGEELRQWAPNRHKCTDLLEAMAAVAHLTNTVHPPAWIDGASGPAQIVVCKNGMLDVASRELHAHDPRYFTQVSVPFDFDARASVPRRWLRFLEQLWPDDPDAISALQQFSGYVLSGRTDLDKILLLIGPTRAGKGVITRMLGRLIGTGNVAGPTLASLGQNFGLQDLIGKPLAVISDARLGHADTHQVVERLLAISGRDTLTVDRKYRDPWTGQLPTRFVIVSNELPRFGDASGAIANRFVVLALTESWLGREDRTLEPDLGAELPGILNWALDGLDRLAQRDRFTEPRSSVDAVIALADLVSPVAAFVRDRCVRGPSLEVACDHLYAEWKRWAEDNGHRPGSIQTFGRDLRAVVPDLRVHRPREEEGDRRPRRYAGVAMKNAGPHPDPQWLRPRTTADRPVESGPGPRWSATDSIVVPTAATEAEVF
jgi:putative DNA primase/helicase